MNLSNGWILYYTVMLGVIAVLSYRFGYKTGKLESEDKEK